MDRPRIEGALGLAWRPRKNGWAAVWLARQDIAGKGYKPTTRQISVHTSALTEQDEIAITAKCLAFQDDMIRWGGDQPKVFGGTVRALIVAFETDPDSSYKTMRYKTRRETDRYLKRLATQYGALKLSDIGARDFNRWYADVRKSRAGRELISTAHATMTVVRMIIGFGATFEIEKTPRDRMSECKRLQGVLAKLKYENGKGRTEAMTLRQCEDIITAAHKLNLPSIALAQALQFDLRMRQGDVIGQWVPASELGISVIDHYHARKWLRGLRWEEVSSTMELDHLISKSRTGKRLQRDLTAYPMVMAELDRIPAEKRTGPIVVCELTSRPWVQNHFRVKWREAATAAGVPNAIKNMDSRAGGITETIEATDGNIEAARKEAEHSSGKTTEGYSRRRKENAKDTAAKVLEFRGKNRG